MPLAGDENFTKAYPDWKENTWETFGKYVQHQFADVPDEEDSNDEDTPTTSKKGKSKAVDLQTDNNGWPILPRQTDETLQAWKEIIRTYVTMTYSKSLMTPSVNLLTRSL